MQSPLKIMRSILTAVFTLLVYGETVLAGRPIILTESKACADAELVVIADVNESKEIPYDPPFGVSKWASRFTKYAEAKVKSVLVGQAPPKLMIIGGGISAGTPYRLEKGHFLILLVKVEDNAYRAVDWHYSFMPIKDEKVGWLTDRISGTRVWMTPKDAVHRINAHKSKSEQSGGAHPARPGGSP